MAGPANTSTSALMKSVDLATEASTDLLNRVQMFLRNIEALDGLANDTKPLDELIEQIGCLRTVLRSLRKPVQDSADINLLNLSRPLDECHKTCNWFCREATKLIDQINATDRCERGLYIRYGIRHDQRHIDHLRRILNVYTSTFEVVLSGPKM